MNKFLRNKYVQENFDQANFRSLLVLCTRHRHCSVAAAAVIRKKTEQGGGIWCRRRQKGEIFFFLVICKCLIIEERNVKMASLRPIKLRTGVGINRNLCRREEPLRPRGNNEMKREKEGSSEIQKKFHLIHFSSIYILTL